MINEFQSTQIKQYIVNNNIWGLSVYIRHSSLHYHLHKIKQATNKICICLLAYKFVNNLNEQKATSFGGQMNVNVYFVPVFPSGKHNSFFRCVNS